MEFERVYSGGAKKASRSFVVFSMGNGLDHSRFGLTTPRRLGAAHERNRIKRRVREILRTSRELLPAGLDVVLNPRHSAAMRPLEELRHELVMLLGSAQ